ncbi:hypothetical protein Agub_g2069 [Astrephomene gubernaculifera]|uniref:Membrane-associated protein n=1 Tax=Astrephomene gubernaculifera TaxID=47775 RepID=A0AAD3DK71_9CHLO|nr:hypothetical protein Agub_g2069 [Astrephomene gubernaculifera]
MASITNRVLIIAALVLALIGWVVALAGVARANDLCNDATYNHRTTHCSNGLRYDWWGVWFTFFLIIVILVMAVMGIMDSWVSTLQAFCAACLSVTMIDASNWIGIGDGSSSGSDYKSAADAATAGFIICSIALMLLIVFIGLGPAGVCVKINVSGGTNKTAPEIKTPAAPAKAAECA